MIKINNYKRHPKLSDAMHRRLKKIEQDVLTSYELKQCHEGVKQLRLNAKPAFTRPNYVVSRFKLIRKTAQQSMQLVEADTVMGWINLFKSTTDCQCIIDVHTFPFNVKCPKNSAIDMCKCGKLMQFK